MCCGRPIAGNSARRPAGLSEGRWNRQGARLREDSRFRAVSYPLEQQLVTDRLVRALTDLGGSLASSYYPLLYRQGALNGCRYLVCVIRLHLPLHLCLSSEYEAVQNIMVNQMRLHMQTVGESAVPRLRRAQMREGRSAGLPVLPPFGSRL